MERLLRRNLSRQSTRKPKKRRRNLKKPTKRIKKVPPKMMKMLMSNTSATPKPSKA